MPVLFIVKRGTSTPLGRHRRLMLRAPIATMLLVVDTLRMVGVLLS